MSSWRSFGGRWWAIHYQLDWWLSLGIHVDFKPRLDRQGVRYGPYVDLHLFCVTVSVGINPIRSTEFASLTFRSGESE